ncbi:histidine kinase [Desulfocarbo indianensis]|nr:histidine kinase [Desulfocarbo indianensis]
MSRGLDLIILDDDVELSGLLKQMVEIFYHWGEIHVFNDALSAKRFCFDRGSSVAVFIIDVFLGDFTAFDFIESIKVHYPMVAEDSIIVTGQASEEVVNACLASDVNYLLEKPIKYYVLQFAIRAIANKYLRFARQLRHDPDFALQVDQLKPPAADRA